MKSNKYNTGGPIVGTGGQSVGGSGVDMPAATTGSGTTLNEDSASPGGYGSSGTKSTSKKR